MITTRLRLSGRTIAVAGIVAGLLSPLGAQASLFQGETLDAVANGAAWAVLVIAPTVAIAIFWLVHILPEKIAEKKHHPQAKAIQVLCLLSLFFGGMLWPLAWLWAYSKPVLHKMAYGTDRAVPDTEQDDANSREIEAPELEQLRHRVARLEALLAAARSEDEGPR